MTENKKLYFIAFYRYIDSKIWQRTNLYLEREELVKYLDDRDYIDSQVTQIMDVHLVE